MENRAHALIAGLFLLLLGAAAVASLWWFSGRSEDTRTYVVETRRNVTGLNLQAQVRFRGIRVGKVEMIQLDPADALNTQITISVRRDIPITRSTVARLGYQGVTGIAHILLEDSGRGGGLLTNDKANPARIAMQDSFVQELSDAGSETLRQARDLLSGVNDLLRPENRQLLTQALNHIEASTRHARETTARLERLLSTENLVRVNSTLALAEQTAAQAGPFFTEARDLVASLKSASEKFQVALGDAQSDGFGALAPRLNELTTELSSTSNQLSRVLQMLEESPQSLIFGRRNIEPGPGESGFVAPAKERNK